MNKADLARAVVEETGVSGQVATAAVTAVVNAIKISLWHGEPVTLSGFGRFELRARQAGHWVPAWKASPEFRNQIRNRSWFY